MGWRPLAALLGGQLLYTLFWEQFQSGQYYGTLPMLVCMIVAGVIGYYIASMLLAKALRVFPGQLEGRGPGGRGLRRPVRCPAL